MTVPSRNKKSEKLLLIVTRTTDIYSETFIRRHIKDLPFKIVLLQGSHLDVLSNGLNLVTSSTFVRNGMRALRKLGLFDYTGFWERRIVAYLEAEKINIVLAEYGPNGAQVAHACKSANVSLIVHFHGYDAYQEETLNLFRDDYAYMFQNAAAIIGVSRDMCQQLISLGAPAGKVHHVPYFVDTDLFQISKPAGNAPLFLAVGRFVEKKAPNLLLRAFAKVYKRNPKVRLEMIGDGPLFVESQKLAKSLGVEKVVHFAGSREHDYVATRMREARCFIQHSVRAPNGDSEGTPVAVLEAQACGLPVIATRHTGIKDVVVEGKTGFLVDEFDVDSMAKHMLTLAENGELACKLGTAGAKRIQLEFVYENTLGRLAAIIHSMAADK